MRVLYEPPHRIQDILSGRLRPRVRVVIREHNNVRMRIVMSYHSKRSITHFVKQNIGQTQEKLIYVPCVIHASMKWIALSFVVDPYLYSCSASIKKSRQRRIRKGPFVCLCTASAGKAGGNANHDASVRGSPFLVTQVADARAKLS